VDGVPSGVPREGHLRKYSLSCDNVKKIMGLHGFIFLGFTLFFTVLASEHEATRSQTLISSSQASGDPRPPVDEAEKRVVEFLRAKAQPGAEIAVSALLRDVFTEAPERKALSRLFNTFFKIPLYVVQVQKAEGRPPSLRQISEQFAFTVPGTADVILRIMESDPRVPRFFERDPGTGEIVRVDVEAIAGDERFGRVLERSLAGWEGAKAPRFEVKTYEGKDLTLEAVTGRPFVLYFWFTNCHPCVTTSPLLSELAEQYRARGLRVIALNADELLELGYTQSDRAAYAEKLGLNFELAHANAETEEAYGTVSVYPTLFFVNRGGVVVEQLVSGQSKAALEAAIKLALE